MNKQHKRKWISWHISTQLFGRSNLREKKNIQRNPIRLQTTYAVAALVGWLASIHLTHEGSKWKFRMFVSETLQPTQKNQANSVNLREDECVLKNYEYVAEDLNIHINFIFFWKICANGKITTPLALKRFSCKRLYTKFVKFIQEKVKLRINRYQNKSHQIKWCVFKEYCFIKENSNQWKLMEILYKVINLEIKRYFFL